jgi:acetyl-CoA carboxylase biotin carboxyl carrier protein
VDEAKLKKLIEIFKESGVDELEYQESFWRGVRVRLGNNRPGTLTYQAPPPAATQPLAESVAAEPAPAASVESGLHTVRAPMVGTFYMSPSPESEPFAAEGDRVAIGQTLCIIEAMKIMNEIECDASGELVEVLVGNGEPVEYNQPVMTIRPS